MVVGRVWIDLDETAARTVFLNVLANIYAGIGDNVHRLKRDAPCREPTGNEKAINGVGGEDTRCALASTMWSTFTTRH